MPRLPGVTLDEAEAARVARQPAVSAARAEVELGGQAVQRLARRRDPARVRVRSEQARLLGIAAKAADNDQVDAGRGGGALHAVDRLRDVGPHRLALAVG